MGSLESETCGGTTQAAFPICYPRQRGEEVGSLGP